VRLSLCYNIVNRKDQTAKLLKYMGYTTACDYAFGLFAVTWFVTRHIFYPMVWWSVYSHTPTAMEPGCYLADGSMIPMSDTARFEALGGNQIWSNIFKSYTDRTGPICWNPTIRYSFLCLLLALQAIICMWFYTICVVVWKVISGQSAEDARSEDEDEDEEAEVGLDAETEKAKANLAHPINGIKSSHDLPVEEEVGAEALNFNVRRNSVRGYNKRGRAKSGTVSRSSAISIPGHGDRKELLGRIGCDKPVD
jgi:acyl-CoA-dependent ceramide synthase